jgi:CMP-N-acetylneuraminic acid synthetase
LLNSGTISKAIGAFWENYPTFDALFSVTRLFTRLWDANGKPVNHDPNVLLRTQDLPPMYLENSCLYIFSKEILEARHNRLGKHPLMFEISAEEAWDIDTELDFEIANFLKSSHHREHREH